MLESISPNTTLAGLAVLMVLVGCDSVQSGPSRPEAGDSAGVTIWSLGSDTTHAALTLEKIGELSLPDSGWVVEDDGLAVDVVGESIYVLDELGPRLLVFTLEGALIGEVGGPGEGPGEYEMPVAVDVDPLGVLRVVDGSRSLLLSWDRQGRFLGQERLPAPYWGPGFKVFQGTLLYVRGDEAEETGDFTEVLTRFTGEVSTELMTLRQEWVPVSSGCGTMPLPKVMTPSITWNANTRYSVAATWPEYSLQVHEGDSLVASLRREIPPVRITGSVAESAVATGPLGFLIESCGMTKGEVVRAAGFVDTASPIDRIAVDPLDRIWTRPNALSGDPSRIEILDVENGYLGSLIAPVFPVAFLSGERFLAIAEKEWGSSVEIWSIQGG